MSSFRQNIYTYHVILPDRAKKDINGEKRHWQVQTFETERHSKIHYYIANCGSSAFMLSVFVVVVLLFLLLLLLRDLSVSSQGDHYSPQLPPRCVLTLRPITCPTIYLHMQFSQVTRCYPLLFMHSIFPVSVKFSTSSFFIVHPLHKKPSVSDSEYMLHVVRGPSLMQVGSSFVGEKRHWLCSQSVEQNGCCENRVGF